ncbi:MAG: glycosyltransferase family 4 protein [Sphingomonadales bacterium]|nr:glycosyltransferase family 4 protein [Sphingomonadales bacterium]MDE2567947.1 glycosyltransferase family 4 protein [Sphingomonadales bacterium]
MLTFICPLPPPTHGMANVNQMMLDRLAEAGRVDAINVAGRLEDAGPRAKLRKTVSTLKALPRLVRNRMGGSGSAYGSVDDGSGGYLTALWTGVARLLGYRIYLHHHSFRYLVATTRPMRVLTRVAGRGAVHVVLCETMAEALRERYPCACNIRVVPNPVTLPAQAGAGIAAGDRPYTIGMLANLTFEKGTGRYLEILRRLDDAGAPVRGVLAGPSKDPAVERAIVAMQSSRPGLLDWLGRVSGEAKERFFSDIDCFLLPSRSEAYPLVIVEALARGVPVIALAVGCIPSLGHLSAVTVIGQDEDFVETAAAQIALRATASDRAKETARSLEEGLALIAANNRALNDLVGELVGG